MPTPLPINGSISPDATSDARPACLSPEHDEPVNRRFWTDGKDQIASTQEGWFLTFVHGFLGWITKIREFSSRGMSASNSTRTPQHTDSESDEKK